MHWLSWAVGMRRTAWTRHGVAAALLTVAMTGSLLTACDSGGGKGGSAESEPPQGQHRQGGGRTPAGPEGPVLAVKIDNVSAARPQTGLDQADLVYAEQVEGGLSRLMAVFATKLPAVVGPVRSARESDLELLGQFHDPTLAFSGAQHKLLPLIDKAPLNPEPPDKNSSAYFRDNGKAAPHNLYLRPQKMMGTAPGAAALTTGFHFGAAPSGGTPVTSRTVRFPSARFTFTWSEQLHRWLVAMDGTPTVTTDGKRVAPATVVVQYVRVRESQFHDVLGNYSPYSETVGSGKAQVLCDGRVFDADWKRPSAPEGTRFTTADSKPVNFAQGQVWVVLAAE
ncbi:DUF3048 domain-containing protein [Streptomyces sp. NPDC055722]